MLFLISFFLVSFLWSTAVSVMSVLGLFLVMEVDGGFEVIGSYGFSFILFLYLLWGFLGSVVLLMIAFVLSLNGLPHNIIKFLIKTSSNKESFGLVLYDMWSAGSSFFMKSISFNCVVKISYVLVHLVVLVSCVFIGILMFSSKTCSFEGVLPANSFKDKGVECLAFQWKFVFDSKENCHATLNFFKMINKLNFFYCEVGLKKLLPLCIYSSSFYADKMSFIGNFSVSYMSSKKMLMDMIVKELGIVEKKGLSVSSMVELHNLQKKMSKTGFIDKELFVSHCYGGFCLYSLSSDVIHSMGIPMLGWKVDAIPGCINSLSVLGEYFQNFMLEIFCFELCGEFHSYMNCILLVLSADASFNWSFGFTYNFK